MISPLWQFLDNHVPVLGWSAGMAFMVFCGRLLWKGRGMLDSYLVSSQNDRDIAAKTLAEVEAAKALALSKAAEIATQMNTLGDNHMSHLQSDVKEMKSALMEKQDQMLENQSKTNDILSDISGNIKVLVDRGVRL
jgi:hypothetical protein